MAIITEDYVSFETAKLLNDKGFNEPTLAYAYGNDMISYYSKPRITDVINIQAGRIPMPTLQLAMKWLREVHHIFIDIDYDPHEFGDKPYFTLMTNMDTCSYYSGKNLPLNRATYEEMAEAGIRYCLENLI